MTSTASTPTGSNRPTAAFVGASWGALLLGLLAFLVGLWHARLALSEKGFYFTVLMFGLFSAVSLQKAVRDRMEGVAVTGLYYGLSWAAVALALLLLTVGLWNATMATSEKGFYAMAFTLSLFAAVAVQKNVRDLAAAERDGAGSGQQEPRFGLRPFSGPRD
jgi:uncharacterized membrane protein YiaA